LRAFWFLANQTAMARLVERNDVNELLKRGLTEQSMIFGRSVIQHQHFYATEQKKKIFFIPLLRPVF
jgi:hypothetical protein